MPAVVLTMSTACLLVGDGNGEQLEIERSWLVQLVKCFSSVSLMNVRA